MHITKKGSGPEFRNKGKRKKSDDVNGQSSKGHPMASKPKKTSSSLLVSNAI